MMHTTPRDELAAEIRDGLRRLDADLAEAQRRGLNPPQLIGEVTIFDALAASEWLRDRDLIGCGS